MQKKLYIVGFVAVGVLTLVSSCSDPAAQAKKVRCEELQGQMKNDKVPSFDNTGTALERSAKALAYDEQLKKYSEASKEMRSEFRAKCQ